MKEWILENTSVTENEYDKLINAETLYIEGESKPIQKEKNKLFEHPMLAIDYFTRQKPTLRNKLKYRVKEYKKGFIHKKIKFAILAELIKEMQQILYSNNRKGKCFKLSLEILKKYSETNIITLLCTTPNYKETIPFLHAAILIKDQEKELILDTTYNIIMKKETYLELLNATIISIISREEFTNDLILIKDLLNQNYVYLDEYLCFSKQVTEAAKKLVKIPN